MDEYYVYRHVNRENGKQYIGITMRIPEQRWGIGGVCYKSSPHFWSAICKYGWDNFDHEILANGLSKEEACEMEIQLIKEYRTQDNQFGYNVMDGGVAPTIPDAVRSKMSNSMMGNKNGLGKVCSEEKRRKISEAQKGKELSKEHRRHISEAKKGKTHKSLSEESRKKIADNHKKKQVYCQELDMVFPSIQECARQTNVEATSVCACCRGRVKSVHGYHFYYYNNDKMPNDYPEMEYTQAGGNGSPLAAG